MSVSDDEHPIAPAIRADIETRLKQIEREFGVRVLYACESGSRGWGFASPNSDYDVRFLYVHPLPWYLQISTQRDVIECPITGDLDINGWELRKALGLLKNGNATLGEWLRSPVVYRAEPAFLSAMQEAARQTHRAERAFHHYLQMARRNYRAPQRGKTVHLKKYLYVLRPLLAALWLEQGRGVVPMRFEDLLSAMVTDPDLRETIDHLLATKRTAPESAYGAPCPVINRFIEAQLTRLQSITPPPARDIDYSPLDRLLMDCVLQQGEPRSATHPLHD